MDTTAITKACDLVGGTNAMASALEVTPPVVSEWLSGGRPVPWRRAMSIESLTHGRVRREELLPEFDWELVRTPEKKVAA